MPALVLSVRDPLPPLPAEPALQATLTVATETTGGDASMTSAFRGRIRPVPRTARQWPHHLSVSTVQPDDGSYTA